MRDAMKVPELVSPKRQRYLLQHLGKYWLGHLQQQKILVKVEKYDFLLQDSQEIQNSFLQSTSPPTFEKELFTIHSASTLGRLHFHC
jgi:hypothetical protein